MKDARLKITVFAVCLVYAHVTGVVVASGSEDRETVQQLEETQQRMGAIAQMLELLALDGLQRYPSPDWTYYLAGDGIQARQRQFERVKEITSIGEIDASLLERVESQRHFHHWDCLKVYARAYQTWQMANVQADDKPRYQFVDASATKAAIDASLFRDPFSPNFLLGYVATEGDYLLVSVGPDGVPDLLPFPATFDGRYTHPGSTSWDRPTSGTGELYSRFQAAGNSFYTGKPDERFSQLRVEATHQYDPTNGIRSSGDVIFHRRGGDQLMFSFQSSLPIDSSNFFPRSFEQNKPRF